jgi:hypothetical protein
MPIDCRFVRAVRADDSAEVPSADSPFSLQEEARVVVGVIMRLRHGGGKLGRDDGVDRMGRCWREWRERLAIDLSLNRRPAAKSWPDLPEGAGKSESRGRVGFSDELRVKRERFRLGGGGGG